MDLINWKARITQIVGIYKYVWIVVLVGLVLLMMPDGKTEAVTVSEEIVDTYETQMERNLSALLSKIAGVGKVEVLLSISQGAQTIYQTDRSDSENGTNQDSKTQTVLITDSQRNEKGLIYQCNPPIFRGAIVLAQGGDDPVIRLAIVHAIGDVTGLGADKIAVLKMK